MGFVETFHALFDPEGRELGLHLFESKHRLHQRFGCLFLEEQSRGCRRRSEGIWEKASYRLRGTAAAIGEDGPAKGHCFHWHNSKVFLSGKNQRTTMSVLFVEILVGERTEECNRGAGKPAESAI